jgi:SAM-dependent methyltransferase
MKNDEQEKLEFLSKCEACGNLLERADEVLNVKGYSYVQCPNCHYIFLNPRPGIQSIGGYYPKDYYSFQMPTSRSLRDKLRGLVMLIEGEYPLPPLPWRLKAIAHLATRIFGSQIKVILPYVQTFDRQPRLLEVGCGSGNFLEWARQAGWADHGVEVEPQAVNNAKARKLNVVLGTLEQANYPDAYFDAILLDNSLEHMHHPLETLKECRRVLSHSGLLIICVPNFESLGADLFGSFWHLQSAPHHLSQFSQKTLSSILSRAGFLTTKWRYKSLLLPDTLFRNLKTARATDSLKKGLPLYFKLWWNLTIIKTLFELLGIGDRLYRAEFITAYCKKT